MSTDLAAPDAPPDVTLTRAPLQPVGPADRIALLDLLRGVAILGIVVVNMVFFAHPLTLMGMGGVQPETGWDRAAQFAVHFFAEGKFYALFSMLFGLGLAVQMERAIRAGRPFARLYARRLFALLAIGVCHGVLIWPGDILTTYAVLGFALLLFRNVRARTAAIWALALIVLTLGACGAGAGVVAFVIELPEVAEQVQASHLDQKTGLAEAYRVYSEGTFLEITRQRGSEYLTQQVSAVFAGGGTILAYFLLGLAAGRRGLHLGWAKHRPLLLRLGVAGALVGIPANWALATLDRSAMGAVPSAEVFITSFAFFVAVTVGGLSFCVAYASGLSSLATTRVGGPLIAGFAPVGRMALSNYLLQSVVFTSLFYGYGLGAFGSINHAAALVLALGFFALQVVLSRLWLRRFRFGPVEWAWRAATYGELPPMRVDRPPSSSAEAGGGAGV